MKYKRGSVWRRWDLHVHTPASIIQEYGGDTDAVWDEFIDKIKNLPSDIKVLGITDYLFVDGYEKLIQRRQEIENIDLILPNIEFRLNTFSGTAKNNRRHNFHVMFDPDVSVEDIREQLLFCLSKGYQISDGSEWNKTPTKRSLEDLGKKIKEAAPEGNSIHSKSDLKVGFENITYKLEDILTNLKKDPFKDKYVTCVGYSEWDQSRWDQSAAEKRDLINKAHFCLTNLDDVSIIGEHQNDLRQNKLNKTILHSSDAHSMQRVGETLLWIKADPTFEGLRQLLYEPSERVAIQTENPTPPRSNYTLEEINFVKKEISEELTVAEAKIKLNKGLVAVAGGKGSGKTAFVDLIAHCFENRNNPEYENSFVYRVFDQAPDLEVKVRFKDGTKFGKSISDKKYFEDCEYVYIAQGELEDYVGKEDLNQYAHNLIINTPKVKNSLSKYEYFKLQTASKSLISDIQDLSMRIEELASLTQKSVLDKLSLKKAQLNASVKDLNARIGELESGLDKSALKKAKKIQENINKLKDRKILFTSLYEEIDKAQRFINSDLERFNKVVSRMNSLLGKANIPTRFKMLEYGDANDIEERSKTVDAEIKDVIKKIQEEEASIRKFELKLQTHSKLLGTKKDNENELTALKEEIAELKRKSKELIDLRKQRLDKYGDVIKNTIDQQEKYKEMIGVFSGDTVDVLKDLEFLPRMSFNKKSFLKNAEDVLDNRKEDVRGEGESVIFKKLFGLFEDVIGGNDKNISDILEEVEFLGGSLVGKVKFSSAITTRDFFDYLFTNYLTVEPIIKYKEVELRRLSLGQKATVLIKIYLAEGDKPIIIDSHDDYLDNKYIMDELIGAIREARKSRQIILVSNNGNVVVNSDAEQVIIADKEDNGVISYISGSLENPEIITKAINVLEGGRDAFKKRQQKYRIS